MARYSIDGQILSDMADAIRATKGEVQPEIITGTSTYETKTTFKVVAGKKYKITFTVTRVVSNDGDGFYPKIVYKSYSTTYNIAELTSTAINLVEGQTETFIFESSVNQNNAYLTFGIVWYSDQCDATFTLEEVDADGNSLYVYTPEEMVAEVDAFNALAEEAREAGKESAILGFLNSNVYSTISLPESLTNLNSYILYGRSNLTITEPWPDSIKSIDSSALSGCKTVVIPEKLPASLTTLGNECFGQCNTHSRLIIPAGVTSIGRKIFYSVFGTTSNLTEVIFLGTPTSIGTSSSSSNQAFYNCSSITSIKVPWSEGTVANAPWGATNATITYDYVHEEG